VIEFSGDSLHLHLQISREWLTSGTTDVEYTMNSPPQLAVVNPVGQNFGSLYESPNTPPGPIGLVLSITDLDESQSFTLQYAIDDGPILSLCAVDRGASVSVSFPEESLSKTPGGHVVILYVFDGMTRSTGVECTYTVIAAPVLQVTSPDDASWREITPGQDQSVTIVVTSSETVTIEYRREGVSSWTSTGEAIAPNSERTLTIPSSAFLTDYGLHKLQFRAVGTAQFSSSVFVYYHIGTYQNSDPWIGYSSSISGILFKSTGASLADREIEFTLADADSPSLLRLDWRPGRSGPWQIFGEFPPGDVVFMLPATELSSIAPGGEYICQLRAFDGFAGSGWITIRFVRNDIPVLTVTSPSSPASFPVNGPVSDVSIQLSWADEHNLYSVIRYRFNSSATWKTVPSSSAVGRSVTFQIGVNEFANHLVWTQPHAIEFEYFDGLDSGFATLVYTVAAPPNSGPPTLSIERPERRIASTGLLASDREFSLTIDDPDETPLYVSYQFDESAWSVQRTLSPGSHTIVIPTSEFPATFRHPGHHSITFRVSDGFTTVDKIVSYVVNTRPTIAISGQTNTITIPATGGFTQTVVFSLSDPDNDALSFLYAIDSTLAWAEYQSAIMTTSLSLTLTQSFPSPRLASGNHTIACKVSDGVEQSLVVFLVVDVAGDSSGDGGGGGKGTSPGGDPSKGDGIGVGAIVGIVIGVVVVIAVVAVAVFCLIRKRDGSDSEQPRA
jgi:hypothetical protein